MPVESDATVGMIASFGPFRLYPAERFLERAGIRVVIGSRAFDILSILVEQAGAVVSPRELLRLAWSDLNVEINNVRVQVAALRKALGDGEEGARYIENVPGRGYCFVALVSRSSPSQGAVAAPARTGTAARPASQARSNGGVAIPMFAPSVSS